jgi:hypothetical protein
MTISVPGRAAITLVLIALTSPVTAVVATSAPAIAATGSTAPALSVPAELNLFSVSCVSGKNCVAVGERVTSSNRDLNVAESWNGSRWKVLPQPPSPGSSDELAAVSCPGRSSCMAVGSYTVVHPAKPKPRLQALNLAEFWNGRAWKVLATPDRGIVNQLAGVSCTAPDRCVAVGWSLAGTIAESWNGSRWQLMTTRNPAPDIALSSVSCARRSSCVTVGGEDFGEGLLVAEVWNGRSWQVRNPPTPQGVEASLVSVSCPGPADCIATGYYGTLAKVGMPLAEQWNGKKWRMLQPVTPAGGRPAGAGLHGASCLRSGSCVAIGATGAGRLLGETWNGRAWHLTAAPRELGKNVEANLFGVSCWQARGCMAVGNNFGLNQVEYPLAEEWNGTSWRVVLVR